jgi:fatty acid-binding protein DegV
MITKVTILQGSKSWEQNPRTNLLNSASNEIAADAVFFNRAASLISFLNEYPTHDIPKAIGAHFGPDAFSVRQKTKTERTYFVSGGLYIHETDKP